jgi:uncharacterized protein YqgC (DUF456 family)
MIAAVVAVVMAVGLVGTIVPFVPGLPLIWLAALGYGLAQDFDSSGIVAMAAITFLLVVGVAAKFLLASRRATSAGAPSSTILAGVLLGFAGFFIVPVVGFILGAVLGVLFAERRRLNDWARGWESTKQVLVGFGIGVVLEVLAGLLMILSWALWVLG